MQRQGTSKIARKLVQAAAFVLIAGTATAEAEAKKEPEIIPPGDMPYGMSYGEWGAAWWQWIASVPANENPQLDPTGENAAAGQSGPVWFLAGNFGGASERTIEVPRGKSIFFPVVNVLFTAVICVDPDDVGVSVEDLMNAAAEATETSTNLFVELDGESVRHLRRYRGTSDAFDLVLPDHNLFLDGLGCSDVPEGTYGPAVVDGYWIMLEPLKKGEHTFRFGGEMPYFGDFSLDLTYHITVPQHRAAYGRPWLRAPRRPSGRAVRRDLSPAGMTA